MLSADASAVSFVLVITCLAAAAGMVSSALATLVRAKKPDLAMALNGTLAGLVGITAGADVISPGNAIIVGLIAGIIVVIAVALFDKLHLDDPVGAIPVHLVCGIWGTLAVGIFRIYTLEFLLYPSFRPRQALDTKGLTHPSQRNYHKRTPTLAE